MSFRRFSPWTETIACLRRTYAPFAVTITEDDPGAQEIGHSYGLDHELRDGDVMSVQAFDGERAFGAEVVACGEASARPCGPSGGCRANQSSYGVLADRLGLAGEGTAIAGAGCSAGGSPGWLLCVAVSTWIGRVRARRRAARARR